MQTAYEAVDAQLEERVAASAQAAARANAALEEFESETGVKPGDDHPLKKVATQAEREAEAARAAKERHAQAIAHGVVPMMMEREQRRLIIEQRRLLFRGPFKDHCHDSCLGTNCVSMDGRKLYGRWPFDRDYILPLCLHTCLCPQQGGHPCPSMHNEKPAETSCYANGFLCCVQSEYNESGLRSQFGPVSPREIRTSNLDLLVIPLRLPDHSSLQSFAVRAHSTSAAGRR